jgi:hypothetical protein
LSFGCVNLKFVSLAKRHKKQALDSAFTYNMEVESKKAAFLVK